MARTTPRVEDASLVRPGSDADAIAVGTPAWYAWLEGQTTFAFASAHGTFTARKERRGRSGWYWKAYRTSNGTQRRVYLGRSAELTLDCLNAAAARLATATSRNPRAVSRAALTTTSLLATKLFVPPTRPNLVARPRLTARLDAGLIGKATLISAPAGFGKTTLVSAWLAQNDEHRTMNDEVAAHASSCSVHRFKSGWVSLDAGDNDPSRFWSYLSVALDTLAPGAGAPALVLLQSPQPPPIEAVLTTLLNGLSAAPVAGLLVLDDYHLIETPAIHQALATLIDYLPPQLHLVITTRADPPLPLARWRARGALTELHAADLRFTPNEVTSFLTDVMGLPLAADQIAALEVRTEGWIAGLHMAALAMHDRSDLAGFIAAFTDSNRFVVEYLAEEVFARQPPHLQRFLLQTSILDRMCGPLCDTVLGIGDQELKVGETRPPPTRSAYSQLLLEQLERANVFIVALDDARRWYRYHHLFAETLQERLHGGAASAGVATLHRRASLWFEEQGFVSEAVQHALVGADFERAAGLVERVAETMLNRGEYITLQGWFEALPEAVLRARPRLNLVRAWTYVSTHQLDAAERCVQRAEAGTFEVSPGLVRESIVGEAAVIRASISLFRNDYPGAVELAQQALKHLPADNLRLRGQATFYLGMGYGAGNLVAMDQALTEAIRLSKAAGDIQTALYATFNQAAIYGAQGHIHQASAIYQQALALAAAHGAQHMPITGWIYMDLGELWYEQNDLEKATAHLKEAIKRGEQGKAPRMLAISLVYLARVLQAQGDRARAFETIQQAEELVRTYDLPARYASPVAAWKVRLWLAQGNVVAATAWANASGLSVNDELHYAHESAHLALARVLIVQGRSDQASPLLERLRQAVEAAGRMADLIEILAVQALAQRASQPTDMDRTFSILSEALILAEQQGNIRKLVDEGEPIRSLLSECRSRIVEQVPHVQRFVNALLSALPDNELLQRRVSNSQALIEPLSERELEVLCLVAAGLSNQAIAQKLVVALSTVKKHLNNINTKLDTQSRTQALARARELNLV
jgi:LuxR family transcriptional regulator, maltose regulon positive regulatory protein